jgi:hypothetical protein
MVFDSNYSITDSGVPDSQHICEAKIIDEVMFS